ncbi:MAG: hypothetical protein RBG1_1C00001G0273 [candidate division Zixibacteria bacterium RBG-1]|nr:MAG: hypothetical protein RBG1_1C00001G0273 [candidate division Zixibacteria bacterium RBG-1]
MECWGNRSLNHEGTKKTRNREIKESKKREDMKKLILLITGLVFLSVNQLLADEKKSEPQMPPKPKFTSELRELSFLVGNFASDITIHDSPLSKPGPGKGTLISQWGLDSTFLLFNVDEIGPEGRYRGHGYLTYDKLEKKYRMWWFNNCGEASEYEGGFVRDTLVLEGEMQTPEKIMKLKLLWHKQGDKVVLRVMADLGEGYKPLSERIAKRLKIGKINTEVK